MAFKPIQGDADFMTRMSAGEFDGYEDDEEMNAAIMEYLSAEESKSQPIKDMSGLGMAANKDMSGYAQATPLQGLMGMAQYNNKPKGLFG